MTVDLEVPAQTTTLTEVSDLCLCGHVGQRKPLLAKEEMAPSTRDCPAPPLPHAVLLPCWPESWPP